MAVFAFTMEIEMDVRHVSNFCGIVCKEIAEWLFISLGVDQVDSDHRAVSKTMNVEKENEIFTLP